MAHPTNLLQYKCQSCSQPLIITESILKLSLAQQKLLFNDKEVVSSNSILSNSKPLNDDTLMSGKDNHVHPSKDQQSISLNYLDEGRIQMYLSAIKQLESEFTTELKQDPNTENNPQIILKELNVDKKNASNVKQLLKTFSEFTDLENQFLEQLASLELSLDDLTPEKLSHIIKQLDDLESQRRAIVRTKAELLETNSSKNLNDTDSRNSNDDNSNAYNENPVQSLISEMKLTFISKTGSMSDIGEFGIEDPNTSLSNRVETLMKIFRVLSLKYNIEYPVCLECSSMLIKQLQQQYDEAAKKKVAYWQFLNKLNKQSSPTEEKLKSTLNDWELYNNQYKESISEIMQLENEESRIQKEIDDLQKEIELFSIKENDLLQKRNNYDLKLSELTEANEHSINTLNYNVNIYNKLKASNVYDDVFNIKYEGQFGTINDLRLGNLKDVKVSSLEINAALGQVILLLSIIIKKLNLRISDYKLIPMGSYSKIEKYDTPTSTNEDSNKTVLECFYNGSSSAFDRLFTSNSLDQAMIALLNVVKQMEEEIKVKYDSSFQLPHKINLNNNKVGGLYIKLNRKIADDDWTLACKYFMADVKYFLAFLNSSNK